MREEYTDAYMTSAKAQRTLRPEDLADISRDYPKEVVMTGAQGLFSHLLILTQIEKW
jgi:hypothetical protein